MTTPITPVNAWGATLSIPQDLEPANSASIALYVQELANRLEYLRKRMPGASATADALRVLTPLATGIQNGANYVYQVSATPGNFPFVLQSSLGSTPMFFPVAGLFPGATIKTIYMRYTSVTLRAGLPAVMPRIELASYDRSTAAPAETVLANAIDPSVSAALYQTVHDVTVNLGAPEVVSPAKLYFLKVFGESGANSAVGSNLISVGVDLYGP